MRWYDKYSRFLWFLSGVLTLIALWLTKAIDLLPDLSGFTPSWPMALTIAASILTAAILILFVMYWGKRKTLPPPDPTTPAVAKEAKTSSKKEKKKRNWLLFKVMVLTLILAGIYITAKTAVSQNWFATKNTQNIEKKQVWVYPDRWTMLPATNTVNLWTDMDGKNQCLVKRVIINPKGQEVAVDPEPYKTGTGQTPKAFDRIYFKAIRSNNKLEDGFPVTYWNQ